MNESVDEAETLVARLRVGDRQALAKLFALYRRPLERMIDIRLDPRLHGRLSPSDILQDAYVDAEKRVEHFMGKPEMPFVVWVRLITGQRLIDAHRQHLGAQMRDAGQELHLDQCAAPASSSMWLAGQLAGNLASPSHAARQAELRDKLQEALDQLDPIDREVLSLRHFEELSNRDTAMILGIEPAAASKRYLRALARLKQVVELMPDLRDD